MSQEKPWPDAEDVPPDAPEVLGEGGMVGDERKTVLGKILKGIAQSAPDIIREIKDSLAQQKGDDSTKKGSDPQP